ncbi:MAG: lysophospholipid acyltransferase family protein [Candidatus Cyclobacteriaceae bacterium M2_1C_046]
MKRFLYEFLRFYVRLGLYFYFSEIKVQKPENIPDDKPVLFTANHQNAFMDALIIVAFTHRHIYFLARASIFNHPIARKLLSLINLMPIYRIRDGKETLANNEDIFRECFDLLERREAILIFPEGNHDLRRFLRPLSKGFTRIALGALESTDLNDLYIVPVGLNYQHHQKFGSQVSMIFGSPLPVSRFRSEKPIVLRETVADSLKKLITHIDSDDYDLIINKLSNADVNFLEPDAVNMMLKSGKIRKEKRREPSFLSKLLYPIVFFNNLMVILLWRSFEGKIKDPVFVGSLKFTYGIFVVPLIYLLQALIIYIFLNIWWALGYFIFSIATVRILAKRKN